ncbi:hypothetical protein PSI9734_00828 [Pseudidiomarina piscicola]|uniref:Uncharacterized protein n=1 Tax=Pseudidiomarina piscicola TaxID=2614830 RepID=A0A6S6WKK2_9GAMM|nr:hypothetical protein PSI9734_00828 [Pseudidiomarina piscicola]VZT39702.1 hypothetical protein PSI9734_00828 [Pseudomonas aeruginosa]
MMMGLTAFSALVIICLLLTACAPVILIGLWLKDFLSKQLW